VKLKIIIRNTSTQVGLISWDLEYLSLPDKIYRAFFMLKINNIKYKKDHVAINNLVGDYGWMRIGHTGLTISLMYDFGNEAVLGVDLL